MESNLCPSVIAGFFAMRALSTMNSNPQTASRPSMPRATDWCSAKGRRSSYWRALPRHGHAVRMVYAEIRGTRVVLGFVSRGTARSGWEGRRQGDDLGSRERRIDARRHRLHQRPRDRDPLGDVAETMAIKRVFKDHAYKVPISSTKSMVGHGFGAGGAVEAVACVMSNPTQRDPPDDQLARADPQCDLDYVPNEARAVEVRYALNNSFGFAGRMPA